MSLEHLAKCDRVLAKALPDALRWDEAWKGLKLEAFSNLSLSHYLKLFTPALTNYLDILVFIWSIFHAPSEFLFEMMVILVGRGSAHSVVVLMLPDDSGTRGRVQIGGKGQRTPLRGEESRWGEKVGWVQMTVGGQGLADPIREHLCHAGLLRPFCQCISPDRWQWVGHYAWDAWAPFWQETTEQDAR